MTDYESVFGFVTLKKNSKFWKMLAFQRFLLSCEGGKMRVREDGENDAMHFFIIYIWERQTHENTRFKIIIVSANPLTSYTPIPNL